MPPTPSWLAISYGPRRVPGTRAKWRLRWRDSTASSVGNSDPVGRLPFQRLVEEKEIGENGPHVARRVQVVHQLRSDRGLSEHEPNRGDGVSRVVIEDAHKRVVGS